MSIEQHLHDLLFNRGLFENQVQEIMERFKQESYNEPVQGRWDDPVVDYPVEFISGLSVVLFQETVKWIDINKPRAWYRDLFL